MPPIKAARTSLEQRPQNTLDAILSDRPTTVPVAKVSGDFTDRIKLVSETRMSLVLSTGRDAENDEALLLPNVEVSIGGGAPTEDGSKPEFKPFMTELLTFENAAYLLVNLSADMKIISGELARFREGGVKPERQRVRQARYLLANTVKESLVAITRLTALLDSYPPIEEEDEPEPPRPRPRRRVASSSRKDSKLGRRTSK